MKKHIGLVELAYHNEVLRAYIIVLLETDFKITIFTNDFNFNQIYDFQDHKDLSWEVKKEQDSMSTYLERVNSTMKDCDLLLVSTLPKDAVFNTFKWPTKSVLVVHDTHFYFEPKKHLSASASFVDNTKENLKIVKFYLLGEAKKNLSKLAKFDYLAVPSSNVYSYLESKPYFKKYPLKTVFDFAINDPSMTGHDMDDEVIITVPGTVSNKSRDYEFLIESLTKLNEILKQKIVIQILGKPKGSKGEKHLRKLEALNTENLAIKTYNEFIDQKTFDEVMKSTHFLVLPILENLKFDICHEKNGYSCVSGNINDITKYGLPAIIPHYYPLEGPVEQMVMRYDISYDLPHKINEWVENKKYMVIREKAKSILEPLSPKEMAPKFQSRILNLL